MTYFVRSLFVVLVMVLSTTIQVTHARPQVLQVEFPDDIPFHIVIRDAFVMDQTIERKVHPTNPSITMLEFEKFKDQARGREVILDTSELCTEVYNYYKSVRSINYYVRFVYFKGNRMYYTDVNWSNAVKAAVGQQNVLGCEVHPTRRRLNVWVR